VGPAIVAWAGAFFFTQAVEVPVWAYALRTDRKLALGEERWPLWLCVAVAFGASAITHPVVWFVFPQLAPGSYWVMIAQAETFAVLVEAAYAWGLGLRSPLVWSVLANCASAGLGLLCRATFGWP
jgi:hypothetical protein